MVNKNKVSRDETYFSDSFILIINRFKIKDKKTCKVYL